MNIQAMFDLTGQTAIVTGGGRGLGEQIALVLAEAGANVVVCSRKLEPCQEVREKLKEKNVGSLAMECDVSNPDDVESVVNATMEKFGQIDILFNNSGATWGAPFQDMPLDKWQKVFDVNANGTFLFSQAVAKEMRKRERGKIINLASVAGMQGSPEGIMDTVGYNASKGAIISFTRDLGVKLAPQNIQVNAIAPGFFPTKMTKGTLDVVGDAILNVTPAGRFGSDEDIQGVALFLASAASDYMVGQTIVVDGGQSSI